MKLNLENKYNILTSSWEEKSLTLKDILSENDKTILFFYPRDNTPGCTTENKDFTSLKSEFKKKWISLVWVSKDSIYSHKKFIEKQELTNSLISDSDLVLHKELWAYWEKNNYWKIVQGVIRSSFLVNKSWEILKEYRNIRAKWHANRLLEELS
jgi:peroxiredoxin Q/BCP